MNDVLKQRLVGALLIIVLGIVFWPLIFTDPNQPSLNRTSQVPAMPNLRKMQLQAPEPVADIEPAGGRYDLALMAEAEELERLAASTDRSQQADPASVVEATATGKAKSSLDDRGIPIAWVIQVITVRKKDRAELLVKQLVDGGYKAYFRPSEQSGEVFYKVYVGPRFERKAMNSLKIEIDKEVGVNSIIARYVP